MNQEYLDLIKSVGIEDTFLLIETFTTDNNTVLRDLYIDAIKSIRDPQYKVFSYPSAKREMMISVLKQSGTLENTIKLIDILRSDKKDELVDIYRELTKADEEEKFELLVDGIPIVPISKWDYRDSKVYVSLLEETMFPAKLFMNSKEKYHLTLIENGMVRHQLKGTKPRLEEKNSFLVMEV
ncbi:hypothetical protein H6G33_10150 [Calothrix sp. FACHB-1219]|uniref:hypothetical protein n=1 Tax=unclassified Calothrix TaxID=2619626 RepID=UPI001689E939|nr:MULTISPECIES: hypothetical protein [unclassified Calothrix]MBD2201709.1 hypothetical protein [Calothrix sp. FACHB-168]MBD2217395.1 hypothetical protein [Calothrix sp. FACHB-1219]